MPHIHGYSRESIAANITRLMSEEHKSQEQAVGESLEIARRAWRHKHPKGPYPHHLRGLRKPARGHARAHHRAREGQGRNLLSRAQIKAAVHDETRFAKEVREVRLYPKARRVEVVWVTAHGAENTTRGKISESGEMEPLLKKLWARAFVDERPIYECG